MSIRFDISDPEQRSEGLAKAKRALGRKQVVVIPTDTGYALAANAFSPAGDSLLWDLGDDSGTVALRLSAHEFCQELVSAVGPLAVSLAVKAGKEPGSINDIVEAFEEDLDYFLVDPGVKKAAPSTIVDATAIGLPEGKIRVLREGKVSRAQLKKVVGAELLAPAE